MGGYVNKYLLSNIDTGFCFKSDTVTKLEFVLSMGDTKICLSCKKKGISECLVGKD